MVVTAWIDADDLDVFNRLRARLFPGELNYLSAHVTLFHHIPAADRQDFIATACASAEELPSLTARVGQPYNLGKGVAYPIECQELSDLRRKLRAKYLTSLSTQDRVENKRFHLTVQNKVSHDEARRTLAQLAEGEVPDTIGLRGISCYRYDGGPWTLLRHCPFGADRR